MRLLLLLTFILACGRPKDGRDGQDGESVVGPAGTPGQDAAPCVVSTTTEGAVISCPGGTSAQISNGANGQDGESVVGPVGPAAAPCTVIQLDEHTAQIVCPDGSTATLESKSKSCGGKKDK